MGIFNLVTRSDVCREFNCHPDSIKRWIKEEGFPDKLGVSDGAERGEMDGR